MESAIRFASKLYISAPLIYWYTPACYLSAVLAHSYQINLSSQALRINILALLTTLLTIPLLFLALFVLTRIRNQRLAVAFNFVALLSIGAVRGFEMYLLGKWLEIDSGLTLTDRISVSTSATLFWLMGLAFVINSHRQYQAKYRNLLSRSLLQRTVGITDSSLKERFIEVEKSLKSISVKDSDESPDSELLKHLANQVKIQIEELIKPLSRRLWISAVEEYPRINFARLFVDATRQLNYSSLIAAVLISIIGSLTLPTFMPQSEAFGRLLITFSTLFLISVLFKRFRVRNSISTILFSVLELSILSFIPIFAGDLAYSKMHFTIANPESLIVYLIIPLLILGLSIISIIQNDQETLLKSISENLSKVEPIGYQTKQVASYLHNSLQSELLAITKKLERAANSDDGVTGRRLIEQLGSLINRSISEDFNNLHSTPKERIRQVIDNWQGIIEIQIENVDEIFKNEAKSLLATQLIEELVSNMAKHSDQNKISIHCSNQDNSLRLEVKPYYSPESIGKSGLGADILNSFVVTPELVSKDRKQQTAIFEI